MICGLGRFNGFKHTVDPFWRLVGSMIAMEPCFAASKKGDDIGSRGVHMTTTSEADQKSAISNKKSWEPIRASAAKGMILDRVLST